MNGYVELEEQNVWFECEIKTLQNHITIHLTNEQVDYSVYNPEINFGTERMIICGYVPKGESRFNYGLQRFDVMFRKPKTKERKVK